MAANVVSLIFTVAFARILGASDYGTLAALVSTFLILQVPGSALQITVAREVSTAIALGHEAPGAGVRRWLGRVAILTLAVTAVAVLLRDQLAATIGVDAVWAAAATLPTGCLWLLASIERGPSRVSSATAPSVCPSSARPPRDLRSASCLWRSDWE